MKNLELNQNIILQTEQIHSFYQFQAINNTQLNQIKNTKAMFLFKLPLIDQQLIKKMQQSQKTFGSQNAIKQLYRQYSGTIKNLPSPKNYTMTQSSNLPFDHFYHAFNSNTNIKNLTLDKFKHSQAKSIIQKLMQTKEQSVHPKEETLPIFQDFSNKQFSQLQTAIPLSTTQAKIFYEVINLHTQIQQIKEKAATEKQQFLKIQAQLKNQGIQISLPEEKIKQNPNNSIFKRFNSQQLKQIYEQNDSLAEDIQKVTQQLTNFNQNGNQQNLLKQVMKQNSQLKKQLSNAKTQVLNAGQIDEKQVTQMTLKVQDLTKTIYLLEQRRFARMADKDEEFKFLKSQNQRLRKKTVQILKIKNDPALRRKRQLIQFLDNEEKNKMLIAEEIQELKNKYESLRYENSRLKKQESGYNDYQHQIESKVSPFYSLGEYQGLYSMEKQNYLMNFEYPTKNFSNMKYYS